MQYKQDGDKNRQSAAASVAAVDAGGGWMWGEECCWKCFMCSQWQLEVEHGFVEAIPDTGDEKEPALQQ